MTPASTVFAPGSISLRLYPHVLPPTAVIDEMRAQAVQAVAGGFDGVMISERHGGIPGNVPNPVQIAGWIAADMPGGWVAPCPVLALLRPPPLIVEEVAWLAARYPGRVGVGLATGGNPLDFQMYKTDRDDLARRFEPVLQYVTSHLAGTAEDDLSRDLAVECCRARPVPVLSAAMSLEAARRAARCRAGIIGSSLIPIDRERRLSETYRSAGGSGPEVLIRFVWVGEPPTSAIASKFQEYRRNSSADGALSSAESQIIASTDPGEIADRLRQAMLSSGRTCLHLRVHVPGIEPEVARDQIRALAEGVLPRLRSAASVPGLGHNTWADG